MVLCLVLILLISLVLTEVVNSKSESEINGAFASIVDSLVSSGKYDLNLWLETMSLNKLF